MRVVKIKIKDGIGSGVITGTNYVLRYFRDIKHDPCAYCGGPANTRDHVIPKGMGGGNLGYQNVVMACRKCNQAKGNKPLLRFLLKRIGKV